jgi:hypothetical protein
LQTPYYFSPIEVFFKQDREKLLGDGVTDVVIIVNFDKDAINLPGCMKRFCL